VRLKWFTHRGVPLKPTRPRLEQHVNRLKSAVAVRARSVQDAVAMATEQAIINARKHNEARRALRRTLRYLAAINRRVIRRRPRTVAEAVKLATTQKVKIIDYMKSIADMYRMKLAERLLEIAKNEPDKNKQATIIAVAGTIREAPIPIKIPEVIKEPKVPGVPTLAQVAKKPERIKRIYRALALRYAPTWGYETSLGEFEQRERGVTTQTQAPATGWAGALSVITGVLDKGADIATAVINMKTAEYGRDTARAMAQQAQQVKQEIIPQVQQEIQNAGVAPGAGGEGKGLGFGTYALIGLGVLAVGGIGYMALRKKKE